MTDGPLASSTGSPTPDQKLISQVGRLISWNNGTATTAYSYDGAGNRLTAGNLTYHYDARNELISDGTNTYRYTANGDLSSVVNRRLPVFAT